MQNISEWHHMSSSATVYSPVFRSVEKSVSAVAQSFLTLYDPMDCSTPVFLTITNSQSLLKLMSIESVMPPNRLILCCPLLLLPSIFPSIRVFSNESVLHIRCPKYWSFNYSKIVLIIFILRDRHNVCFLVGWLLLLILIS